MGQACAKRVPPKSLDLPHHKEQRLWLAVKIGPPEGSTPELLKVRLVFLPESLAKAWT